MREDVAAQNLFTRRTIILAGLQTLGFAALAGRLTWLQLFEGTKYRTLAEENRIATRIIVPPRGLLIDRAGVTLAGSVTNYQALVIPEQTPKWKDFLAQFTQHIPLDEDAQKRIKKELARHRAFSPILLKDHLTWDELSMLEVHQHTMPGLVIAVGTIRNYPFAQNAAHVLGYVAPVSEAERASGNGDMLLEQPGYLIGKGGIEKTYEMELRGTAGHQQSEVNAHGRVIRELAEKKPIQGHDIHLMLDAGLQQFAQERMVSSGERAGAAVLIDVHTGAVHALASHPSYDPNAFTLGIESKLWRSLNTDETAPLTNKVISGQYAPGSTFKCVTALAILDAGISPQASVTCHGHYDLGRARFHCWKRGGHGTVNLHGGIMHSCDTYFYEMARRIGVDRLQQTAEAMGLGKKFGIDLPGERPGLVPSRAWKKARIGEEWQGGETLIAAIGQGYVLATPLQLAVMTARIVNGGYAVTPQLRRDEAKAFEKLSFKQAHLDIVRKAMEAVVNTPGATAYGSKVSAEDAALAFGGKTGTSQVRRISKAERATGVIPNERRPWKDRDHALFIGYAPLEKPRFAVAVIVEHGGGGSKVAAPIARDILLEAQRRIP